MGLDIIRRTAIPGRTTRISITPTATRDRTSSTGMRILQPTGTATTHIGLAITVIGSAQEFGCGNKRRGNESLSPLLKSLTEDL